MIDGSSISRVQLKGVGVVSLALMVSVTGVALTLYNVLPVLST